MNNQAAQTMPELPRPVAKMHYDSYTKVLWLYPAPYSYPPDGTTLHTADQVHQYARDYAASQTAGVVLARGWFHALPDEDDYEFHDEASGAGKNCEGCIRAMIVAAPAASGVDTSTNEVWAARAKAKIAAMDAAASVSERARELLAEAERGPQNDYGTVHRQIAHRAIEQALTQQRGESSPVAEVRGYGDGGGTTMCWTAGKLPIGTKLYATPQPGAEALLVPRDLVSDARDWVRAYADTFDCLDEDPTMEVCRVARELESLLGRGGK